MTSYSAALIERLGVQDPRILWSPVNLGLSAGSAGKEVVALARLAGLTLDPWQELFIEHCLAYRPDKRWCAREVGLVVSRQNGKGSILEALELGSLFLLQEEMCIHSAHLFDTSQEQFNRIMVLLESTPELMQHVKRVTRSHGEEGIEVFRGGKKRRLRFKTRTKGGGRGLTGDRVVIDEAMYFSAETAQALMPVISARPNPQIIYTGSAGTKDSVHFGRVRQRAIEQSDPRLCYMEWSIDACTEFCPKDCEDHDPQDTVESYAKANPALGIRISVEGCESERRSMDKESFAMERLGVGDWPVEGEGWLVIPEENWMNRIDPAVEAQRPLAFSLDVTPDRRYAAIAVCGSTGETAAFRGSDTVPSILGEITAEETPAGARLDHRPLGPNGSWVVPRLKALHKRHKRSVFVIDKGSQAGTFWDELEAAGLNLIAVTAREYAQACGLFYSAVCPRGGAAPTFVHKNDASLTSAVSGAVKRDVADLWAWDKRNSSIDISPLVATTNAHWGYWKHLHQKKPRPMIAFA